MPPPSHLAPPLLRKPIPERRYAEPTLAQLMRAEEERERRTAGDGAASTGLAVADWDELDWSRGREQDDDDDEPESAVLHPPLYGRPGPSPSPDIFTSLLLPLLSLSRPPSRSNSPPASPSSSSSLLAIPRFPTPALRSPSSLPAHFPPRTSNDPGPTVESQGFVLYLASLVAWVVYLVWSLGTDEALQRWGIAWYPSREWALLVPAWTIMLAFFIYFSYIAVNLFITPDLNSLHTLTDNQAYILPSKSNSKSTHNHRAEHHPLIVNSIQLPPDAVPPLHDLPIGLVNRVVFGDYRRRRRRSGGG